MPVLICSGSLQSYWQERAVTENGRTADNGFDGIQLLFVPSSDP